MSTTPVNRAQKTLDEIIVLHSRMEEYVEAFSEISIKTYKVAKAYEKEFSRSLFLQLELGLLEAATAKSKCDLLTPILGEKVYHYIMDGGDLDVLARAVKKTQEEQMAFKADLMSTIAKLSLEGKEFKKI